MTAIKPLSLAIRQTIPKPTHGLAKVETTTRDHLGVRLIDGKDGTRLEDYEHVWGESKPFTALVSVS